MQINFGGSSIFRNFQLIVFIVIISICLLAIWFTQQTVQTQRDLNKNILSYNGQRIAGLLQNDLDVTKNQIEFIVNDIKIHGIDTNFIYKSLNRFSNSNRLNISISWNMFSWVNSKNLLTIDGNEGILKKPIDLSKQDYITCTMKKPGELCLGKPVYGALSKQWLIPIAIGVPGPNKNYLGAIVFGLDINSLTNKIAKTINLKALEFIIIDELFRPVADSFDNNSTVESLIDNYKHYAERYESSNILVYQPIFKKTPGYSSYQKLDKYPYTILLSYDKEISHNHFVSAWLIRMIEFLIIALSLIVALFFLFNKLVNPLSALSLIAAKISQGEKYEPGKVSYISELALLEYQLSHISNHIENEQKIRKNLEQEKSRLEKLNQKLFEENLVFKQKSSHNHSPFK